MVESPHGFFAGRRPLDLGLEVDTVGIIDYPNIPRMLGIAMTHAPLRDLDSVYSLSDMYDILEKAAVDSHNQKRVAKARERERRQK